MKQINVLTFGAITEITGQKSFVMEEIDSTENLVRVLEEKYPSLRNLQYILAVNKEVIQQHTDLATGSTVAILPPFSGG